jgi:hypothetical protein
MTAHIRLIASDGEDSHGFEGKAVGLEEATVGLPEEAGRSEQNRRNEMLGEAAPPLFAEAEDRTDGRVNGRARPKDKGPLARLIALAGPRKTKAAATIVESAEAELQTDGNAAAGSQENQIVAEVTNGTNIGVARGATAAAKARRSLFTSKGTIAVVLLTGVAAAAIMLWNWPRPAHPPQVVEPGMLADQPTKLMAPSAALAKVSPREEPNVSRDRPEVHETRGDEVKEVLSFKGLDPSASPQPTASSPVGDSVTLAKPAVPTVAPSAQPAFAASKPEAVAPLPPPPEPAVISPPAPWEPGLGEAAKIEMRLGELEAALKDRLNAPVTRADVDKAETQTSGQIAQLAAIVTRLTGQVKDLQGAVQTVSSGSETKFADLTRRVSMTESKNAVAAAERANDSQGAEGSAAPNAGVAGQAQGARTKVASADQKHNYRIQAASPGLAMLSAIDGGADARPVEIAIGTDLPGYGKVRSIEQHGQAWIIKTDRGEIE